MTDPRIQTIRQALPTETHGMITAEKSHNAARALASLAADLEAAREAQQEAGLILVALGEPCAECGHVDWRADDERIDSYRNALASAKSERDEAYRQAAQADEANVMMGARCRDVEIALATAEALADRRLEALRQASDCCSRPPGVCFDSALARLSAGKETT